MTFPDVSAIPPSLKWQDAARAQGRLDRILPDPVRDLCDLWAMVGNTGCIKGLNVPEHARPEDVFVALWRAFKVAANSDFMVVSLDRDSAGRLAIDTLAEGAEEPWGLFVSGDQLFLLSEVNPEAYRLVAAVLRHMGQILNIDMLSEWRLEQFADSVAENMDFMGDEDAAKEMEAEYTSIRERMDRMPEMFGSLPGGGLSADMIFHQCESRTIPPEFSRWGRRALLRARHVGNLQRYFDRDAFDTCYGCEGLIFLDCVGVIWEGHFTSMTEMYLDAEYQQGFVPPLFSARFTATSEFSFSSFARRQRRKERCFEQLSDSFDELRRLMTNEVAKHE